MLQDKLNGKEGKFYNRLCTYKLHMHGLFKKKARIKIVNFFIKMKKLTIEKSNYCMMYKWVD